VVPPPASLPGVSDFVNDKRHCDQHHEASSSPPQQAPRHPKDSTYGSLTRLHPGLAQPDDLARVPAGVYPELLHTSVCSNKSIDLRAGGSVVRYRARYGGIVIVAGLHVALASKYRVPPAWLAPAVMLALRPGLTAHLRLTAEKV
jgi:hypothetical protein